MGTYFEELLSEAEEPEPLEGLREQILALIKPGFYERVDVVESAIELGEDDLELSDQQIERLVDELWHARLAEQASWPDRTDADRVADALAALDATGVVARMNFTCCQTCGTAEIRDERPRDRPTSGYVFFHQQDAERLADEPAYLFLGFGPLEPERDRFAEQTVEVGHRVTDALRAQSLPVVWVGTSGQRIQVGPITWLRRLPQTAGR